MHKSLFNIAWVGGRLYSKYLGTLGLTFIPTDAHSPFWILTLLCIHPFIFPSESPKGRRQRHFHSPGKQLKLWIIMGSYSRLTLKFWALSHWVSLSVPTLYKVLQGFFFSHLHLFWPCTVLNIFSSTISAAVHRGWSLIWQTPLYLLTVLALLYGNSWFTSWT